MRCDVNIYVFLTKIILEFRKLIVPLLYIIYSDASYKETAYICI
jgi:hypothetical protein